jgi:predicted nucleic acid-binding protein
VILVDTNVLYALADRRDKHHARCAAWLQRTPGVLMVPATVLAETCYLIDRTLGPAAEAAFLDSVGTQFGFAQAAVRAQPGAVHIRRVFARKFGRRWLRTVTGAAGRWLGWRGAFAVPVAVPQALP